MHNDCLAKSMMILARQFYLAPVQFLLLILVAEGVGVA